MYLNLNPISFYFGLLPMAALSAIVVLSFFTFAIRWALMSPEDRMDPEKGAGRERGFWVAYFYTLVGPVCRVLDAIGFTPNLVTLGSLLMAITGSALLANSYLMAGASLILLAASADAVDGFLARIQGSGSEAGAFLDSFTDRLTEGVVFIGLAWLGDGGVLSHAAMVALVTSFAVSYARARGESLGVDAKVGIAQRPMRLTIVCLSVFFLAWGELIGGEWATYAMQLITAMIGFVAIAAGITAARRAHFIYDALLTADEDVSPVEPTPSDQELFEKIAS